MRYPDWGVRSPRWRGIRSETIDVAGTSVHFLRADAAPGTPADAPVQLLVHGMAASGTLWLDVMRPLTRYGPVIAPDLPGTLAGHTGTPCPEAARAEPNARFLRAFTTALGLDRVMVHGWSMGGLVALLFAATAPDGVAALVLVNPSLPRPLTAVQKLGWQTLGRLSLAAGPALARGLVRLYGHRLIDLKLRYLTDPDRFSASMEKLAGGDPSRFSPDYIALSTDQMRELRSRPRQLANAVTAFASAMSAMYVRQRRALAAIDQVTAPVLLLWGDQDPLIDQPVIDGLVARRPDWDLHVFASAGHLAPLELPDAYVRLVGKWAAHKFGTADPRIRDDASANSG
jgi:pimeloyl-ACP methyl ester carboxylesterase